MEGDKEEVEERKEMILRKEIEKDMEREDTQNKEMKEKMKKRKEKKHDKQGTKWRGVTVSLQMGGQGHPTPIHTPTPSHKHLDHFSTQMDRRTNRPMDGLTDKASHRVRS